jgi:hypothetical protein
MVIIVVLLVVITYQARRHYALHQPLPAQMQGGR